MKLAKFLKISEKRIVAIEWSNAFLRIAQLSKSTSGYQLIAVDAAALGNECVSNGQIVDYAEFAETLIDLLKRNNIQTHYAGFVLAQGNTIIKGVRYDKSLSAKGLYDALLLDMQKHISQGAEDTYFDYQLLGDSMQEGKQDVLLIAAHKSDVEPFEKIARMCHLLPEVLDIDSYLLRRFLQVLYPMDLQENSCVALVGLNTFSYKIHFLDENEIYFNDQKALGVNLNDEEYINSLIPWFARNIQMFEVGHSDIQLKRLFLYGERVEIERLIDNLKEQTEIEIEILDPFKHISLNNKTLPQCPESYVLTLALATREVIG
ncbi:type IV pilus biogenesis protein PilM [Fangia hongkongensis]|uniref:type IV pilus biogenesis protein PilM n=2 Tax=Fangia hongkongensis TaxID=270495 RepID=UPI000377944F|nr:pilus assembly protein PilM [Fangia hongkongensis]